MDIKERFYSNLKVIREQAESKPQTTKTWEVSYDYGPHMSNRIKVNASSESEAWKNAKIEAKKQHGHDRVSHNWTKIAEGLEQLDEKMNVKKMLKNVKRAFAGWSGAEDPAGRPNRPKDVIKRFDRDWSSKKDQERFASRTDKEAVPHSPAGLQVLRAKRNLRLGKVK